MPMNGMREVGSGEWRLWSVLPSFEAASNVALGAARCGAVLINYPRAYSSGNLLDVY